MSRIIPVKVSQKPKQVNTKFGRKTVCHFNSQDPNTPKDQREIVIWGPPNDSELMSLKVGEHLRLLHDGKKYHIVEPNPSNNGNGASSPTSGGAIPIDSDLEFIRKENVKRKRLTLADYKLAVVE